MKNKTICGAPAESWGIEKTDDGYTVNAQVLIERYIRERPTVYDKRGAYYVYDERGLWVEQDNLTIRKILRKIVNYFVPYIWSSSVNSAILNHLPLICPSFDLLLPAKDFINFENGLLNLDTFSFMPHNKRHASLV